MVLDLGIMTFMNNSSSAYCRGLVLVVILASGLLGSSPAVGAERAARTVAQGEVSYLPPQDEAGIPERFRLAAHTFAYEATKLPLDSQTIQMWDVTFPSPVETKQKANNTVHCEFFLPQSAGGQKKVPGVIVLHILGGDFALSRVFCNTLAQRGVAALFLKMPYYGPRREPGSSRRMISPDPHETVEGMTQAVLDIRRATAWLAAREDIDSQKLGIFGISLGGITGALAATAEPRLGNVCLLLAGGDLGKVAWESRELDDVRKGWIAMGGTKEEFMRILLEIDPVTYAANARGRRILMMNAKEDEVIPKVCTESLWKSLGEPPIHWYKGGHYSVAWHLLDALDKTGDFFLTSDMKMQQKE